MTKQVTVMLTSEQRAHLIQLTRSGTGAARVQTKARILVLTDRSHGEQRPDAAIAAALGVSRPTIIRTRQRFVADGLDAALHDRPRPGAQPKITGDVEAQLTLLACSTPPNGNARWTLQMLADKLVELELVESISDVAVHHRLKKRAEAVACEALLYRHAECQVRGEDGRCTGRVSPSLQSNPPGGVRG